MPIRPDLAFDHTNPPGWFEESEQGGSSPYEPSDRQTILNFVNTACWAEWEQANRAWLRQVEENVRMVSGRQQEVFLEQLQDFVDISTFFIEEDEVWRQNPTYNWLAHYYKLTLSKLTENLPALGFLPRTSDWNDAALAQVGEPIWKYEWQQMNMAEYMFDLYGWVILAARAITKMTWSPDRGPAEEFRGPLDLAWMEGNAVTQRQLTDAPYVRNNEGLYVPALQYLDEEQTTLALDDAGEPMFGQPYSSRLGDMAFKVLVPTSVRTPHGSDKFWEKAWYTEEYLLPVTEVERRFGVEVDPDNVTSEDDLTIRLTYGQNYGMPGRFLMNALTHVEGVALKGLVRVREHWRRVIPNHPTLSRGRVIITTKDEVLYDDINPFWVDGSAEDPPMPYEAYDAVPMPFRNEGFGDLEAMNPIARALNRRMAAIEQSVEHNEQPVTFYNKNAMTDEDADRMNRPGALIGATFQVGQVADRLPAADLPRGSVDLADRLQQWLQLMGSQPFGSEGMPVTEDASGELQREVRFDTDRVWGATLRLHSYAWARQAHRMFGILRACMTDERLLTLAGEDAAAQFLEIGPLLFKGGIHAYPQPESQVLESRQEKQNRITALVAMGLPPQQAFDALGYPDVQRALRPNPPAYSLAERENLEMMLGALPEVFEEHDHATHLLVHKKQQQTHAYRDADPVVRVLFRFHVQLHEAMQAAVAVGQAQLVNAAMEASTPGGLDPTTGLPRNGDQPAAPGDTSASSRGRAPRGQGATSGGADPRRAAAVAG